ncbi:MAG: hypothetical protein B9J98_00235 [Candidatus Terraquivivens tikiterensis]|uniref:Prephenate/arogenate dehydrogenase domain-containing protein n=1 Tax=Candidatus Terraquivivens tikiterensis TaxID=1980982 RepID=A0A2R7Y9T5_9ARCH|nr:MAG: hypothetical protein B9J98_00235 [Candidatus Terraquivivens tikiterensis]
MKAAVIGAGKMGGWFAKYFCKKGYDVRIFDKRPNVAYRLAKEVGTAASRSLEDAVRDADVTLVAVPPGSTASVVVEASRYAKHGSVVVEVSSIKAHVIASLKRLRHTHARLLSVHPLFGPGASSMRGKVVALVPIKSKNSEMRIAKSLFDDAKVVAVDWRTHDRAMAYVLSLSHALAVSLVFAMDNRTFRKAMGLSGTTFKLQILSAATSLSESPELMISAFKLNPYALRALSSYRRKLGELSEVLSRGDLPRLRKIFRACTAKTGPRLYEEAYGLLEGYSRLV